MELSKRCAYFRKYRAALRNASGMELNRISRRVSSRVLRHGTRTHLRNLHVMELSSISD